MVHVTYGVLNIAQFALTNHSDRLLESDPLNILLRPISQPNCQPNGIECGESSKANLSNICFHLLKYIDHLGFV